MSEPKTVRVRIAVAVSDNGVWAVAKGDSYKNAKEWALEFLPPNRGVTEAVHFIEADIPLPVSQTIEGEVQAEQKGTE